MQTSHETGPIDVSKHLERIKSDDDFEDIEDPPTLFEDAEGTIDEEAESTWSSDSTFSGGDDGFELKAGSQRMIDPKPWQTYLQRFPFIEVSPSKIRSLADVELAQMDEQLQTQIQLFVHMMDEMHAGKLVDTVITSESRIHLFDENFVLFELGRCGVPTPSAQRMVGRLLALEEQQETLEAESRRRTTIKTLNTAA